MAKLTPLSLDEAREVLRGYHFGVASVEALDGGSVNSNFRVTADTGQRFFLRVYEEQGRSGAERELGLLDALAQSGVPTPRPVAARDGSRVAEHVGKPVALFPWVDGEILCQKRVQPEHCRRVGAALASVHLAPVSVEHEGRFTLRDLRARLDTLAAHPSFAEPAEQIRAALERYSALRDPTLPAGLVHGDLFRDNVLWRGPEIAALIDFESASRGPFAYDLMVTVLAWCFGDSFDVTLVEALVAGYDAVRPLAAAERAALRVEGALAALRFAATRITDYSLRAPPGAPPLRDYRRFLQRLTALETGVLDSVLDREKRR